MAVVSNLLPFYGQGIFYTSAQSYGQYALPHFTQAQCVSQMGAIDPIMALLWKAKTMTISGRGQGLVEGATQNISVEIPFQTSTAEAPDTCYDPLGPAPYRFFEFTYTVHYPSETYAVSDALGFGGPVYNPATGKFGLQWVFAQDGFGLFASASPLDLAASGVLSVGFDAGAGVPTEPFVGGIGTAFNEQGPIGFVNITASVISAY